MASTKDASKAELKDKKSKKLDSKKPKKTSSKSTEDKKSSKRKVLGEPVLCLWELGCAAAGAAYGEPNHSSTHVRRCAGVHTGGL